MDECGESTMDECGESTLFHGVVYRVVDAKDFPYKQDDFIDYRVIHPLHNLSQKCSSSVFLGTLVSRSRETVCIEYIDHVSGSKKIGLYY